MQLVIIESPFAGNDNHTEAEHRAYLERCIRDSVTRGESPYASHKMLTDALDDSNPDERDLGIKAGFEFKSIPGIVSVFYVDYGWSRGMELARDKCLKIGGFMEFRTIGKNNS